MSEKTEFEAESHTVALPTGRIKFERPETSEALIPVLTVIDGPRIGSSFRFTQSESEIIIGRTSSEFIINDETVSRRHARVTYVTAGGKQVISLTDLNSTNGTFVNGKTIKRAELRDGDKIHIGGVLLRFEMLDPIDAKYITDISRMIKAAEGDPLTGLFTRKYMEDEVPKVIGYLQRRSQRLCLLMIDIDRFKQVNDSLGHLAGDEVLRQLGKIVRDKIRGHDIPVRYGGEEIAIFLPACELPAARAIGERLRCAVENFCFDSISRALQVTISLGLTELCPDDDMQTLIARADEALYDAKHGGRNQLCERLSDPSASL